MTLLSLSEMITAELRGVLDSFGKAEVFSMPSIEAFDSISPLPIWLEVRDGGLCYCCPISRVMAAKYHLDMKFLAMHWSRLIGAVREKKRLTAPLLGRGKFLKESHASNAAPFPLEAATQMYQDDDLLVWRIDPLGGFCWLDMVTALIAQPLAWKGVGPDTSCLEGLLLSGRQRTVEREFGWQYSYASSFDLSQRTQSFPQEVVERWEILESVEQVRGLKGLPREETGYSAQAAWGNILPLLMAQMNLVDAIALMPQRWVPAVDSLSEAWANWLSTQVLNDLRLRQMAYAVPVRNLAYLTQSLLGLAIRLGFEAEPALKL